jgi:2'-5' RNA ligase
MPRCKKFAIVLELLLMTLGYTSCIRSATKRFVLPRRVATMTMASSTPRTESDEAPPPSSKQVHHVTICMVPPPEATQVWKTVSEMRMQLKDPGYYRWPPHANLLYPFLEVTDEETLPKILEQLHSATRQCRPFSVRLNELGTFGGKQRGVLWLHPDSSNTDENDDAIPLLALHQKLVEAFPMCKDQTKGGKFSPHMTLSHFESLDDAMAAKKRIETDFPNPKLEFVLDRVYLLRRQGDDGQFLRIAEIGLGPDSTVERLDPSRSFPDMPTKEDDWVHEERMNLKARRNGRDRRGGGRLTQRRSRSREPRVPDTLEAIATKRAERKAKRERLERERELQEIERALEGDSSTETN